MLGSATLLLGIVFAQNIADPTRLPEWPGYRSGDFVEVWRPPLTLNQRLTVYKAAAALAPAGGTTDQFLRKDSATDYDYSWQSFTLALDDLTDVTLTAAAEGEFLRYNGSAWVNSVIGAINTITIDGADATDQALIFSTTSDTTGAVAKWNHDSSTGTGTTGLMTVGTTNAGGSLALLAGDGVEYVRIGSEATTTEVDADMAVFNSSTRYGLNLVHGAGAGITAPSTIGYRQFVVEGDANAGGSILGGASGRAILNFGSADTQANAAWASYYGIFDLFTIGTTYTSGKTQIVGGNNVLGVYVNTLGNVGIKTAVPATELDVNGDITVSGTVDGVDVSSVMLELVNDTTPQLGGMLDVNTFGFGDGTRLLLDFVEDASAVNYFEIENQAAGDGPILRASGTDANIPIYVAPKGTGNLILQGDNVTLDATGLGSNANFRYDVTSQRWVLRADNTSKNWYIIDSTNSKTPFEINNNTDDGLLVLGITAADQVDVSGNLKVTGHIEFNDGGKIVTVIPKTADEGLAGPDTTLQNDDDFVYSGAANATYYIEITQIFQSNTSANFKADFTVPSGATAHYRIRRIGTTLEAPGTSVTVNTSSSTKRSAAVVDCWVYMSTTAGNIQYRWAQNAGHASTTTVYAGSLMKIWEP